MRNLFAKMKANPWLWKNLAIVAILVGVGAGGYWWGRKQAIVNTPGSKGPDLEDTLQRVSSGGRVVAYLYNMPVYRDEFADYLIARFGKDRLEFMINRKIVETECQKHGIYATEAEIADRLDQDLWAYGGGKTPLPVKDFESKVLRNFGKTLFEWKEDVIRPKIMMEKYVRANVKITDEDVQKGYEARFGPKVDCRMIVMDGRDKAIAQKVWEQARKGRAEFLEQARKQFIPQLASVEGKVPPIHKHLGDKVLEETAFRMKKGDISSLLDMKDGTCVILMCEEHLEPTKGVRIEEVRLQLAKEIKEARIAQQLPAAFAEMKLRANPQLYMKGMMDQTSPIMPASFSRDKEGKVVVPPAPVPQPVVLPSGVKSANPLPENPLPAPQVPAPQILQKNEKK